MSSLVPILPQKRGARELDVVFVHGLGGHFQETWLSGNESWPEWIAQDNPNYHVWSYSYPASSTNWRGHTVPLLDRAYSLHSDLTAEDCGHVPLVFIMHSLGGLVVKQMMRNMKELHDTPDYPDPVVNNTKGLIFFGTPHQGSDHAKLLSALSTITRSTITIQELENSDHRLTELNTWFVNKFPTLKCECLVFQETKPVTVLGTSLGVIVDNVSSNPGIPHLVPVPLDEDHVSMCKFSDRNIGAYKRVIQHLKRSLQSASPPRVSAHDKVAVEVGLANVYPPLDFTDQISADSRRTAKYKLSRRLNGTSINSYMDYAQDFRERRELTPVKYVWSPFRWLFPTLDFKVVNNTSEVLLLSELTLIIASSRPHNEVLLVIRETRHIPGSLQIANEGSMPACDATAHFNVFPADETGPTSGPYEFNVEIGDIVSDVETIVLRQADVESLISTKEGISDGIKKSQIVQIAGELSWKDDSSRRTTIPFRSAIYCGPFTTGLFCPPSGRYSVMLKAWGDNYRETVALSQQIGPGQADRFQVVVGAPCWSDHKLELEVRGLPSVSLELGTMDLEIFIPRSQSHSTKLVEALNAVEENLN